MLLWHRYDDLTSAISAFSLGGSSRRFAVGHYGTARS
jgi:hypothetical protein